MAWLATNDSAVKVLGDEQLRTIARELVKTVCAHGTTRSHGVGERAGQSAGAGRAAPALVRLSA